MPRHMHRGASAPGPVTPQLTHPENDDARTAANGRAPGDEKTFGADSEAQAAIAASDKAFADMRAQFGLAGWSLQIVDDGHGEAAYLVSRWGRSRTLPDRQAVLRFMAQIGVAS